MANTIDTYADAAVMAALLTRDFSSVGNGFEDSVLTSLKNFAFAGVKNLQRLILPNVTVIGGCAFFETEVSGSVTLPWSRITKIGAGAFCGGNAFKESSLSLPVLRQVGVAAFMGQTGLTSFSGPALENLSSETIPVSGGVFEGSGLQTFSAPIFRDTNYHAQMFKDCTSLTNVSMPSQTSVGEAMFEGCTSLTGISLPEAVYCNRNYGFRDCSALTDVSLPKVQSVGGTYEFYRCTSLEEISLPLAQGTMGMYFFGGCTSLRSVSLPLITALPSSCFNGCSSLTFAGLDIPEVTSLGSSCFYNCTAMTAVSSDKITTIGSSCFYGCSNLEEVTLTQAAGAVQASTFYNCRKLVKVELGGDVTSFGNTVFNYCYLLDTVILSGVTSVPTIAANTFQNATLIVNKRGSVYVPDGLVAGFQAHSIWGLYDIKGISALETI